ncbi:non-ribosomal peptide synthetase [Nostoc minutum NIES-26]|uniref:Non-ribosomal peptide synthetase n=1 Tax=Nostoc minutum NIES-26 TaxID=1844469 RepID=A0A367S2T1_9NOSO|nr:non-ribosomal peptide synthetase [Nostoc minutum NIES-26]
MKSIQEFLSYLSNLDIRLWLDGDRLRCNAPQEVLTPVLQAQIAERKAEIIQFLKQVNSAASSTIEAIQPVPRDTNLPLSFGQQGLWFIDQLEGGSAAYNQIFAIQIKGLLNVTVLQQALDEVVQRHEILRTTFKNIDGQAFCAIAPQLNLQLSVIDWQHLPKTEQWREVQQLSVAESQQPFNLAQGILLRTTLLKFALEDYLLLFTIHHAIADAWSSAIVMQELAALYEAFSTGKPSPLPELPIQYTDFANWQQQKLHKSGFQTQLNYWQQKLSGTLPILQLPSDRPRPAVQTFRGATTTIKIGVDVTQKLKKFSQQEKATLFMTLLAAFKTLLYRYTDQEDICVGTTTANRHNRDLESLIGYFLNTIVMRTDLSGNPSFRELLGRVRDVAWEAFNHQDLPFELLVAQLQPKRDLSHTPLFQALFVLENVPTEEVKIPGLTLKFLEMPTATAKFDLTLSMRETEQGLLAKFEYNTDLFDAVTISRMAAHFENLLLAIATNQEQRLGELPLLSAAERHQLLVEWNNTEVEYPNSCVHQLFSTQVECTPDAVAVVYANQKLTYRQLNTRANQLAHYLQKQGVKPQALVGICAERSLEMIVGLLGILKAGCAYVPLDPDYPQQRLALMLGEIDSPVLLTQQHLVEKLSQHQAQIVCLDSDWQQIAQQNSQNPTTNVSPDDVVYVIYTSGSTGKPKGAINIHQAVCNRLLWMQDALQLSPKDRVLQKTPFSFDVSVWEFFWPLLTGASLVFAKPDGHRDSAYLVELIAAEKITTVHFVPSMLQVFLSEPELENCHSLKRVICSGEALSFELEQRFFARVDAQLYNLYGPTEAAIDVTWWHCQPNSRQPIVPIGRPIANTQIYILDKYLQPVPVGVPGELHIGGVGLAKGYLHREDLTPQKFIANPFKDEIATSSPRLYKTGDRACYAADGTIEYLGRIDFQVKIRGFRIELGEIEAVLSQYPQVQEVVVVASEDEVGSKRLVAYIVPKKDKTPTIAQLRQFLESKLPNYMVPAAFVMLEALPLMPNGKVNRQALPAPDTSRPELEKAFAAPRTPAEVKLAEIWAEFLNVEQVGIDDNFFELGGDSIIAIQIITKANQAGLKLTNKQLFQHQTIAELAARAVPKSTITEQNLQAEQGTIAAASLTPIQHWFFEQNLQDPHYFNQTFVLELRQILDPGILEQALQELILHHDALRLQFERTTSGWKQVLADRDVMPFTYLDLSTLAQPEQEQAFQTTVAELQSSFNLSVAPLVRVALFNLGVQQPSRLLLTIHHLVVDIFSWRILLEDLQTCYQQLSQARRVQLPAKTTSFLYWSERLQNYAHSAILQQQCNYWFSTSHKQPPLPVDFPDGENTVASARNVAIALNVEESQVLLQKVSQAYNTQINDVLITALAQAFAQWTGDRSVLVALESYGREDIFPDVELSRTVGWFTSLFPILLNLEKASHPGEALKAIKEQLRSIPNRGIGYGVRRYLSEKTENGELLPKQPQPEVLFNYLGQLDRTFSKLSLFKLIPKLSGLASSPQNQRSVLLEINGFVINGQLQFDLTYSEKIHQRSSIERLAQEFVKALQAIATHCQSPEVKGYTPSDFPEANLNQKDLDQFLAKLTRKSK